MRLFFLLFLFFFSCFLPDSLSAATCGGSGVWPGWDDTEIYAFDCDADAEAAFLNGPGYVHTSPTAVASGGWSSFLSIPTGTRYAARASCNACILYVYLFCSDTCDDCDEEMQQAITECGESGIVWENEGVTCDYHCDQGACEDEYQVARQECTNPYLVNSLTCEYSCACSTARAEAEQNCPGGYYLSPTECQYACKCCPQKEQECLDFCGSDNIENYFCSNNSIPSSASTSGGCSIDPASYVPCECINPPDDSPQDPVDDPEGSPSASCADFEATCSAAGCTPSCTENSEGEITFNNCDCGTDPADPGPDGESGTPDDGEAGSADDGANGWLKEIEENTDRTAGGVERGNEWIKTIKENSDIDIENNKKYFSDGDGKAYLKTLNESADETNEYLFEIVESLETVDVSTEGVAVLPENNTYSTSVSSVEDDQFTQLLSNYIATGIPLISYIENSSIILSSASPQLSMTFWGHPVSVDFSQYAYAIDIAGNILFGLTVMSSIMMIVTRIKG